MGLSRAPDSHHCPAEGSGASLGHGFGECEANLWCLSQIMAVDMGAHDRVRLLLGLRGQHTVGRRLFLFSSHSSKQFVVMLHKFLVSCLDLHVLAFPT